MLAVITGDIINSRKGKIDNWISILKMTLNKYGEEPRTWEIFRGDSFQISIEAEWAILTALHIKAAIKQTKLYDVRMAIGIGEEKYKSPKITESNGSAYVNSGECFESLKKQTLAIKSNYAEFDQTLNVMLDLSQLITNSWSGIASQVIEVAIENPDMNQSDLAKLLGKSQSSVSEALKRGGFEEIMNMNTYYQNYVSTL